ncbi:MAG: sugar transferase [Paludibacter sp.]|nr:sugar transferase [Paludibacter sp.]
MNNKSVIRKYIFFDIIAALIVWLAFVVFRKTINDIPIIGNFGILIRNYDYFTSFISFPFYCLFVHYLTGFYLNLLNKAKINIILSTLVSSLVISFSVFFVLKLRDVTVSSQYFYFSLLVLAGLMFCVTFIFRSIIYSQVENNFKIKKWTINTIIIGTGENAIKIANELEKKQTKNTLAGFISSDQQLIVPKEKVLGNFTQLESIFENRHIDEAIIALDNADEQKLFKYINALYKFNIDIKFTPRLYEILTGSARINNLTSSPLVSITQLTMPDWEVSVKRFFDMLISAISLVLISPLFVFCMIRIKFDSKGPIFYFQERIGMHGKAFKIIKFRTMHQGAELGQPRLSSSTDERITNVGRILRKYRIDEFPQFFNILKGDMSLVGPRPERKFYITRIIEEAPYYCLTYKIRPGLTSWGPIKVGYADTIEKMIERLNYDIIYMENMSLLNDLKILIYTIEIIFKGKGI